MTLLSWPTALGLAAVAVPLLLLLYFLKLRRQERKVSSTLLWKKTVQDLQVNAPFQRLRRNLLLLLQLLVLAAVLLGLAEPVANFMRRPERSIVLLVDRSGSMNTVEEDGRTRLELAKDAAVDLVDGMRGDSRAMVISFADRATVECSFTNDKRRLKRLIRSIEPTDASSRISEALQLAVAYSTTLVEETGDDVPQAAAIDTADIELLSDGRIADADEQNRTRGHLRYHRIGAAKDNVGIVDFDVRRDFERPGLLSVFAHVENFGPETVESDVSLSLNGRLLSVREVTLGPAAATTTRPGASPLGPPPGGLAPAQNVIFEFLHESGGIVEVTLHREDALPIDNRVTAPIDPPRRVRILAVTDRPQARYLFDRVFRKALAIEDFTTMTGDEYEAAPEVDLLSEGRSAYDLVLFDNHDTDRLPPGNYLFFSSIPKIDGVAMGDVIKGQVLITWQENHPLMRNVHLDNIFVAQWKRLALPDRAVRLVEGEDSVVMAFLTDPGHRYVIIAFDLLETDFPLRIPFPIFMQNVVMYLAGGGLLDAGRLVSPGGTITIPVPPGAHEVRITDPKGAAERIEVRDRNTVTYARTHATGTYRAEFDDAGETIETFAANILDRTESLITPHARFTLGAEQLVSASGETKVNRPLWPYAAAAALIVLIVEWWVYNKRVMI